MPQAPHQSQASGGTTKAGPIPRAAAAQAGPIPRAGAAPISRPAASISSAASVSPAASISPAASTTSAASTSAAMGAAGRCRSPVWAVGAAAPESPTIWAVGTAAPRRPSYQQWHSSAPTGKSLRHLNCTTWVLTQACWMSFHLKQEMTVDRNPDIREDCNLREQCIGNSAGLRV